MRNAVPVRWIEQAEAREVITASRFQLPPPRHLWGIARDAASRILLWLGALFGPRKRTGWPMLRPQPALLRAKPAVSDHRRQAGGEYY